MHRTLEPGPARLLVIAHRGASADHPENTLAAFAAAAEAGADLVELDARITADGVAVALHDLDLDRTTDARGAVHAMPLAEVKRADASGGRGPRQEVPTLAEVLELLAETGTGVDVEIKNLPGEPSYERGGAAIVEAVLGALEGFPGAAIVTSFDPSSLRTARRLAPEVATGLLTLGAEGPEAALDLVLEDGHPWLLPHVFAVDRGGDELLGAARDRGVAVGTWTVDDEAAIERLFARGVAAVATNRPAIGVGARDRVAAAS
ncbi:MAG TPA: glycerophosphodiester phosphodiesterase [Actinomycetota bacterium]|nr:glycerophosphodiester phosphodiesterase [Actinomycetota bacterium]